MGLAARAELPFVGRPSFLRIVVGSQYDAESGFLAVNAREVLKEVFTPKVSVFEFIVEN